jgi:hypothetical protein
MSESYFKNFNIVSYGGASVVDITERVVELKNTLKNPYIFYPMNIVQGVRPDQLAYANYEDPYTSWIMYITNDVLDPYFEWYLTDYQMTQFIKDKYGNMQRAMDRVAYYRNDYSDKNSIGVAAFNALTPGQMQYWEPVYGVGSYVIEFRRKALELKASTNFILSVGYTGDATGFVKDEVLNIKYSRTTTGTAQFIQANSTNMLIQHIDGDAFPHDDVVITANSYIYGVESSSNVNITSCEFISNNIPADVYAYWAPVYYYDIEIEKNEGNKTIRLLQVQYVPDFLRNFKTLLSQ